LQRSWALGHQPRRWQAGDNGRASDITAALRGLQQRFTRPVRLAHPLHLYCDGCFQPNPAVGLNSQLVKMEAAAVIIRAVASQRLGWRGAQDNVPADADPVFMAVTPTPSTRYGVILLNSNARSHFALTNAIGVVGPSQLKALRRLLRNSANPWLVLLHHQVAEYPVTSIGLRERIGQRAGSIGGYRPALATCYRIAWLLGCGASVIHEP
jgi:hypothetical protein